MHANKLILLAGNDSAMPPGVLEPLLSRIEADRPGVDNFLISDILIYDAYL